MRLLLMLFGIAVAATAMTTPGQAQNYPWCALYSGGGMGGARNCGFTTFEQCQATISGIGGTCMRNTMFEPYVYGPAAAPHHRSRHKHYD